MFRSGFFNSKNHDKQYYASDLSKLFDSLINPGVFENVGNKFVARPGDGMRVIISSGMAWFNSTWTVNDSDEIVAIDEAPYVADYKRIDGIFLKVYPQDDITVRENTLYYAKGTEVTVDPVKPVPEPVDNEMYIPFCYITVQNGVTEITASMIENCIGTESTPFITGILETADISDLLGQWSAQWNEWLEARKIQAEEDILEWTEIDQTMWSNWFDSVKDDLAQIDIGNLELKVDALTNMYVQDGVIYLPNTAASVTSDGTIVLGSDLQEHIAGGNVTMINIGGIDYTITPNNAGLAQVETGTTASKSYSVGEFLVFEGTLYKVVSAIQVGDDFITSGAYKNVEVDNLGNEITQINNDLTAQDNQKFRFGYDSESGKYGYITESGGADTFNPFRTTEIIDLGTGTSFDVSSIYEDYQNLTVDDFICDVISGSTQSSSGGGDVTSVYCVLTNTKSYNATTGVLTASTSAQGYAGYSSSGYNKAKGGSATRSVHAYLIVS